jgi:hypothetical protein
VFYSGKIWWGHSQLISVDLLVFLRGFWEKRVFPGWFFVVKLWWFCGESVVVGWWFLASKKFHFFQLYFRRGWG